MECSSYRLAITETKFEMAGGPEVGRAGRLGADISISVYPELLIACSKQLGVALRHHEMGITSQHQ